MQNLAGSALFLSQGVHIFNLWISTHSPLDFKQREFYFDCAPWILKGKISISILPPMRRLLSKN